MPGLPTFPHYWITQFKSAHAEILHACEGLTDDQLHYQPSSDTNSIAWLVWHLYRWQDIHTAEAHGEMDVWTSEGWPARFSVDASRHGDGDTPEQVAAFRPGRDLLFAYATAAHEASMERISRLSEDQMTAEGSMVEGDEALPYWLRTLRAINDTVEHTGQIAYLRGLVTGIGWKKSIDWTTF